MAKRRYSFMDSPLGQFYLWYTRLGDEPVDRAWLLLIFGIVVLGVAAAVLFGWP